MTWISIALYKHKIASSVWDWLFYCVNNKVPGRPSAISDCVDGSGSYFIYCSANFISFVSRWLTPDLERGGKSSFPSSAIEASGFSSRTTAISANVGGNREKSPFSRKNRTASRCSKDASTILLKLAFSQLTTLLILFFMSFMILVLKKPIIQLCPPMILRRSPITSEFLK